MPGTAGLRWPSIPATRATSSAPAWSGTETRSNTRSLPRTPPLTVAGPGTATAPCHCRTTPCSPTTCLGAQGGKHGAWWVGDYQGLAASTASAAQPLWNDTRTGALELFTAAVPQREASLHQA